MEKRFLAEASQPQKSWHTPKPQAGARQVLCPFCCYWKPVLLLYSAYEYKSLSNFHAKFLGQIYHLFTLFFEINWLFSNTDPLICFGTPTMLSLHSPAKQINLSSGSSYSSVAEMFHASAMV